MSVVSASKSLTVMDGCPALHSSRQEWETKRSAAVLCFLGTSPVFRSLVMSSSSSLLATNSPWASMDIRRRNSVHRLAVMASASEWEQEQEEKDEGESFEESPDAGQQYEQEGGESYEEGSEPYEPYVEPPEGAKLFVGNLPFDVDSEQLAGVFEKAGIVEVVEVIYDRETNRSRGFAFVSMSTVEEAEKAIEMFHQYELSGRRLTVNKAAPRGSRVDRPPRFGGDAGSSNRLYVGNLPWGADDARLGELFSEHGKVLEARIVYDRETGRSRGFGFVTLSSPEEVDDAIASLDGADFDGRPLRVNVAEERPRRSF